MQYHVNVAHTNVFRISCWSVGEVYIFGDFSNELSLLKVDVYGQAGVTITKVH